MLGRNIIFPLPEKLKSKIEKLKGGMKTFDCLIATLYGLPENKARLPNYQAIEIIDKIDDVCIILKHKRLARNISYYICYRIIIPGTNLCSVHPIRLIYTHQSLSQTLKETLLENFSKSTKDFIKTKNEGLFLCLLDRKKEKLRVIVFSGEYLSEIISYLEFFNKEDESDVMGY